MQAVIKAGPERVPDGIIASHPMQVTIGRNIKAGRIRRDMSVSVLADTANVAVSRLQDYEAGAMRIPPAHLVSIIDVLDMRLSEVFGF